MKRTLLDLTQNILGALNSDEVNSISDTTESLQVAEIIKTTYYNIISRSTLPEHYQVFQLNASTDADSPVLMYRPDNVSKIEWIKYFDTDDSTNSGDSGFIHDLNLDLVQVELDNGPSSPAFKYVTILPINQFLDMTNTFNPNDSNVESFTFGDSAVPVNSFQFYYKNDRQPSYCTVLQDYYVIFDTYNSQLDSTLQSSKTLCFGEVVPLWEMRDDFYPDIDVGQVPLLLNEAKSLAFFELKQMAHPKAEQEAKRQWSSVQKDKSLTNKPSYFDQLAYFGRR